MFLESDQRRGQKMGGRNCVVSGETVYMQSQNTQNRAFLASGEAVGESDAQSGCGAECLL
jgi:hypothetical protein